MGRFSGRCALELRVILAIEAFLGFDFCQLLVK